MAGASPLAAQLQFDVLRSLALPGNPGQAVGIALGDVDGDGDLDLAIGNHGATAFERGNRLFVNDGM